MELEPTPAFRAVVLLRQILVRVVIQNEMRKPEKNKPRKKYRIAGVNEPRAFMMTSC